jgi:ABC-type multidrug transport system fused ATPase/permease subunit
LGTGLILLFAAEDIMQGTLTVGDLALFVFYLSWLSEMTHFLGRLMARFRQAAVSFERTMELQGASMEHLIEHGEVYLHQKEKEMPLVQPVIRENSLEKLQIQNLTYVYEQGNNGIHNISFSIPKGTLTVITGEVGAGKSTLVKVILGLLPKQKGKILWFRESRGIPCSAEMCLLSASTSLIKKQHP